MLTQPLWLILFFVLGVSGSSPDRSLPFDRSAEEHVVYEAMIEATPVAFVIREQTTSILVPDMVLGSPYNYLVTLRGTLPTLETETWYHLLEVGDEEVAFPTNLKVEGGYSIITDDLWTDNFGTIDSTAWERFEREFGVHAFGTVSRVGFNRDGTQALLYRGVVCGVLCGSGGYVLLEKVEGAWQVVGEYEVWMS